MHRNGSERNILAAVAQSFAVAQRTVRVSAQHPDLIDNAFVARAHAQRVLAAGQCKYLSFDSRHLPRFCHFALVYHIHGVAIRRGLFMRGSVEAQKVLRVVAPGPQRAVGLHPISAVVYHGHLCPVVGIAQADRSCLPAFAAEQFTFQVPSPSPQRAIFLEGQDRRASGSHLRPVCIRPDLDRSYLCLNVADAQLSARILAPGPQRAVGLDGKAAVAPETGASHVGPVVIGADARQHLMVHAVAHALHTLLLCACSPQRAVLGQEEPVGLAAHYLFPRTARIGQGRHGRTLGDAVAGLPFFIPSPCPQRAVVADGIRRGITCRHELPHMVVGKSSSPGQQGAGCHT